MSQLKCGCIYATTQNTPAVRTGHEMGGYLKEPCELHRRAPQPVDAGGDGELWIKAMLHEGVPRDVAESVVRVRYGVA